MEYVFQSTPLIRGETFMVNLQRLHMFISIHSPHARGDPLRVHDVPSCRFQSTPLSRGETGVARTAVKWKLFQSTPLSRRETRVGVLLDTAGIISIHSLHTRGDLTTQIWKNRRDISIRSPLTRGDSISLQKSIRIYVSLHNKTMIHRFSRLYKPLFCGAKPDIRGAKPTGKP